MAGSDVTGRAADKKRSPLGKTYLACAMKAHADGLTKVDVAEFGGTVFARRLTVEDRSKILTWAKGDPFEQALYTVIFHARDENGDLLFSVEDKVALKKKVGGDVIEALAHRINNGVSYEAVKKN